MSHHNKIIWIIDDDSGILEVLEIILKEEGYRTKVIHNGLSIQSELEHEIPNLILLDILMSGIDGRDIIKTLKSTGETKHIPIILMSADMQVDEKALEARADGYLRKPFNIEDILAIVNKHIH